MAKLRITRKSEYFNWTRDYRIYLNGQKIGTIGSGETKEFDIPEGENILKAKIDWCGSQNFQISLNKDEIKNVLITGFAHGSILMILMSPVILLPILFREFIKNHLFLNISFTTISIFVLLILTYYLTIGRNKYLEIKENLEQPE